MSSRILEAGIDWLTATARPGPHASQLFLYGCDLLRLRQRESNKLERQTWQAYQGEYCGGVYVGTRPMSTVVRLSGDSAQRFYQQAIAYCDNVSRLDAQITVQFDAPEAALGARAWQRAITHAKTEGRPGSITRVETYQKGYTLYLGSRSSDRFGRLYDKFAESHEECYRNCWRYEVELKQEQAFGFARELRQHPEAGQHISNTVHAFFSERGVYPHFEITDAAPFRRVFVEPPDDEKRLEWLQDTILPVIDGLIQRGHGERVAKLMMPTGQIPGGIEGQ